MFKGNSCESYNLLFKCLKGTVVNCTIHYSNGKLLEISPTVPLSSINLYLAARQSLPSRAQEVAMKGNIPKHR